MSFTQTNLPCPIPETCGNEGRHPTSDAFAKDEKGGGYCFSCKKYFPADNKNVPAEFSDEDSKAQAKYVALRGIGVATLKEYKAFSRVIEDEPLEIALAYPKGTKMRSLVQKKFMTQGDMSTPQLFGMDKFAAGATKSITITEGEFDAMAARQMLKGNSVCVSVRTSASALKDLKHKPNYEYVNSFDKIVIVFDNDPQGRLAAENVAGLFDFSKVYKIDLQKFKDPNEYLTKSGDNSDSFFKEWINAKKYTPDSILSSFSEFEGALKSNMGTLISEYPLESLTEMLRGYHEGELVVWKGLEGIGKTEIFRLVCHHLLSTTDTNVGIIHLEEDVGTTLQGLSTYHLDESVNIPHTGHTDSEVISAIKDLVKGNEERVVIYDSYDTDSSASFLDNVRFMVKVLGCRTIFFDHISWLATNSNNLDNDERRFLDSLSQNLKTMAKELGFCLHMISHVNDDGKTRGSRNITKVADVVIDLSRDKGSANEDDRLKTKIFVEKARGRGRRDGLAGFVVFDPVTTKLQTDINIL